VLLLRYPNINNNSLPMPDHNTSAPSLRKEHAAARIAAAEIS
jgi:hypothetical protein